MLVSCFKIKISIKTNVVAQIMVSFLSLIIGKFTFILKLTKRSCSCKICYVVRLYNGAAHAGMALVVHLAGVLCGLYAHHGFRFQEAFYLGTSISSLYLLYIKHLTNYLPNNMIYNSMIV